MKNSVKKTNCLKNLLVLFFALALVFILLLLLPDRQVAFADDGRVESFVYDGNEHIITPDVAVPSAYSWFKDGNPFDSPFSLCLSQVSDSGVYALFDDDTSSLVYTVTVTVTPRPLSLSWRTGISPDSAIYDDNRSFVYNGYPHGVFPALDNVVFGDSVFIDASLNTATGAGTYVAEAGDIYGEDADNYVLLSADLSPTFTVKKATLTLTLPDLLFNYGYDLPSLYEIDGMTVNGLVYGEELSTVITPTCVSDYSKGRAIGIYHYTFFCDSDNYEVLANKPTITVYPTHLIVEFSSSSGEYGYTPNFKYSIENLPAGVDEPDLKPYLDNYSVGTTTQRANPADDNFTYEIHTAEYTVTPRLIEFAIKTKEISYGDAPAYTVMLTNGTLAYDDKVDALGMVYSSIPKGVGDFPVTAKATAANYSAPDYAFTVTVTPMPINVTVSPTTAVYGGSPVTPNITVKEPLPYGKTVDDLNFVQEWRPEMQYPGTYAMGGTCTSPYFDVTVHKGLYTVLPCSITVFADIPTSIVSEKVLGFDISTSGFINGEQVPIVLEYIELDKDGLAISTYSQIPVVYCQTNFMLRAKFAEETDKYIINFVFNNAIITVYPRTVKTSDGLLITLPGGFTPDVKIQFGSLITDNYTLKYAHETDFQKISAGFTLNVSGTTDRKVTVRVPVKDPYKHYTAAIEKSDGVLTYTPCTVEDGYAVFTTDIGNTVFLLWEDKDIEPYIIAFLALLILMIGELVVFTKLRKKYVMRKTCAFAAIPFIGIAGPDLGGIYTLFALCVVEAAVCFVLLIGIVILSAKMHRLRKAGL